MKRDLEICRRGKITEGNVNKEQLLRYKLEKLEEQKDIYWKQRAHVHWLKNGDRNTKFFHKQATERRRRSRIRRLVQEDGGMVTDGREIHTLITEYYKTLFLSNAGNCFDEVLQHVPHRVTQEMNATLIGDFTDEEIKLALSSIGDLKAPGVDGMPALFYKQYWETIGSDVIREVRNLLQGGEMPDGWNDTAVVLIPKVLQPERIKDLRPISLCTVLYKIASKVLSNRLKLILPDIMSLNQSAFVPGRLITDNVLLACEFTHFMKNKKSGKEGYAAIKLDMSKAYDRVEWEFLRRMMEKMGFVAQWIQLIMRCISTVSYKIAENDGEVLGIACVHGKVTF